MPTLQSMAQANPPVPVLMPERATEIELSAEIEELRDHAEWKEGVARKTLLQHPGFQITLRMMRAQACIPKHSNPGRVSVQPLFGKLRMRANGQNFDLTPGKLLVLDQSVQHDVEALEDSAFLLTVSEPVDARQD